jgi:hypothetical protein
MSTQTFKTGREAVEALPRSISVGPFDFKIERLSAQRAMGQSRFGEFSGCEGHIAIQLDMPCAVKAAETFLHELGHAIFWTFGIEDEDKEERTVNLFSTGWTQVFRDNPWALDWMKRALR